MAKIFRNLVILLAIGTVAGVATYSYFSDTETSTGNTFAAGKLDLRFQVEGAPAQWTDVNGAPLFSATDLFNGDLKPGDKGEKTVRLWVDDNPSCGKVSVSVTEDKDNTCTEPEGKDENLPSAGLCDATGELNDAVNFAVWEDPNCNNVLDTTESILTSGTITENKAYGIGELPTSQATAKCYGIAYCFGTWNGTTCDGSLVNNATQTDSFKADIIIDALQKRNQYPNGCPTGEIGENTACIPAPSGMISWWPGDGNINDIAGTNNVILQNGATFSAGKVGQAFNFQNAPNASGGQYAGIVSPAGLPSGSFPRTVDLWFKTATDLTSATESSLFEYGTPSNGQMFGLLTSSNAPGRLYFYGHNADLAGPTILQPNTWYHGAVTYDGTTVTLYLNGQVENSAAIGLNTVLDGSGFTIGFRPGSAVWNGQIDEVEIFNRALSQAEIAAIYNADSSGKCKNR